MACINHTHSNKIIHTSGGNEVDIGIISSSCLILSSIVTHIETPDRNFFYAKCPYCEMVNSVTFNPETEVQSQTCEHCKKQFIADWSKVR